MDVGVEWLGELWGGDGWVEGGVGIVEWMVEWGWLSGWWGGGVGVVEWMVGWGRWWVGTIVDGRDYVEM